ncbi:glycoside hydrolase [Hygrophoropsis aurantiaca]|uniref:Glycoside hydrolase n=1 Tax=Hygrophoropsis aurantiaca TaxID=72124 RepID=A0ACB8AJ44_9AGAM|nr:glycoside hydrolase [Hygrophoropsis aurantiaca]
MITTRALLFARSIFVIASVVLSNIVESGASGSTPKAGLAWPNSNYVNVNQFLTTHKVSWYYTWSPYSINADVEFVPMLWGQSQVNEFAASIDQTISREHVTAVLGMNEPQQSDQSNLTPEQGAQMWKTYLEPLRAKGIRLGSPAPSSAPSGKVWIQDFLQACNGGCTVDFIALHWYDVDATAFELYVQDFYETFKRPIWVTEWACQNFNDAAKQCSYDDIVRFMNQTQTFMDKAEYVERYAWFGAMENLQGVNVDDALMDKAGKINSLGRQYIAAQGIGGALTARHLSKRTFRTTALSFLSAILSELL